MVVRTGTLVHFVLMPVRKDILAETVHGCVHQTVNLTHVETQTDRVLPVLQDGRVIIVPLNVYCPMERIASIHVIHNVSTRRVTA